MAEQENGAPETPGQRIQKLREAAGMSEAGLADHLGISQNAIKQMESAGLKNYPSLPNGVKIARLFGVDPEWIIYGQPAKPQTAVGGRPAGSLSPEIEALVAAEVDARLRPYLDRWEKIDQEIAQREKSSGRARRK